MSPSFFIQFLPNAIEALWVLAALFLSCFSIFFNQAGPEYVGGLYYIGLNCFYLAIAVFVMRSFGNNKVPRTSYYILGCLLLFFTEPLFENDHFRYLWEGRAWFFGYNPYRDAAANVMIEGEGELLSRVGYPHLTSIYPILAQFYFALFSPFSWRMGLLCMQVVNAILVFLLWRKLIKFEGCRYMPLLFLFWQKEFIQSIHIDLLAAILFFFFFSKRRFFFGLWVGMQLKIISIAILPFVVFKKTGRIYFFLGMVLSFVSHLALIGIDDQKHLNGALSFSQNWVWNPGLYGVLLRIFPKWFSPLRLVTFFMWASFVLYLFIMYWHETKAGRESDLVIQEQKLWTRIFLVYASMMFFSPVYNAWYAVWFLIPALMVNLRWGICYALMSFWSYLFHGHSDFVWLSEFFSHIFFFPAVVEAFKKLNYKVELHEDPPSTQNLAQKT